MLGIGVDDIFVICNALDQQKLEQSTETRFISALRHAGPAITITSLTNALAFLSGALSSIPIIQSFCMFCSLTIMMLYLSVMTMFLCVVYWDASRVAKKRRECCGLCFCKENSFLFCRGKLLSESQQKFSGIFQIAQSNPTETEKIDDCKDTTVVASQTEKVFIQKVAPILLNKKSKIAVLIIYAVFTAICIYGCLQFKTYFSTDLLVNDG